MFEILLHLVGDRQMIRIKISMASEFLAIKKKKKHITGPAISTNLSQDSFISFCGLVF